MRHWESLRSYPAEQPQHLPTSLAQAVQPSWQGRQEAEALSHPKPLMQAKHMEASREQATQRCAWQGTQELVSPPSSPRPQPGMQARQTKSLPVQLAHWRSTQVNGGGDGGLGGGRGLGLQ